MGGQDPLRQQQLHGLPSVPDRPLPVLKQVVCMPPLSYSTNWPYLSSLPPTNVLELIGCEPGPLEPDTGPLAPLAQPGQEPGQQGEHFYYYLSLLFGLFWSEQSVCTGDVV